MKCTFEDESLYKFQMYEKIITSCNGIKSSKYNSI